MFLIQIKKIIPDVYRNAFNFSGRTQRAQYFIDLLVCIISALILSFIFTVSKPSGRAAYIISSLWGILNLTAIISSTIRRLKDGGYPRFNILLLLIPVAGPVWLFSELCRESGHNGYQSATRYYERYVKGEKSNKEVLDVYGAVHPACHKDAG